MAGRRSAVIGVGALDDPDRLFERTVTVDLPHIVRLEAIESALRSDNGSR
jgi:hypothetical protein